MDDSIRGSIEKKAIMASVIMAFLLSLFAISAALISESDAIMLDGMISFVFSGIGLVALRVSSLVSKRADRQAPFGYYAYEPLLNFFRGILILAILMFSFTAALEAFLHGGREVQAGYATLYALISSVFCLGFGFWLKKQYQKSGSSIIKVDSKEWQVDGFISIGVGLAFLISFLLQNTRYESIIPYIDPGVILVICIMMITIPIQVIRTNWREIVGKSADKDILAQVGEIVESSPIIQEMESEKVINVIKIGRVVFVQIYLVIPSSHPVSITEQDTLREELYQKLKDAFENVTFDISFTHHREWALKAATPC